MSKKMGLVLTGGGARAAYQAGVLKAIAAILQPQTKRFPFPLISGISAGAINSTMLAATGESFSASVNNLCQLWTELNPERIISTDVASLTKLGTRWLRDISLGGLLGGTQSNFILDVQPLRGFLKEYLDWTAIQNNLNSGELEGLAVTATNYKTGTAITFFDGKPELEPWMRSSRIGMRNTIGLDHILASAAIPILFPPVKLNDTFFGDGSIRMSAPLSPVIHMGAEKVLAVGVRYYRPSEVTWEINQKTEQEKISLADISGIMLNATFFDTLDSDVERMDRINQTVALMKAKERAKHPQKLRAIPILVIRPSRDLGSLASEQFHRFPAMLRYLLAGIGASDEQGWDLLSYLAFDKAYTAPLIDLGYSDGMERRYEILEFFS